jgi:hypothetical protein
MSEWIHCPICGDSDMKCVHEDDVKYIHCVNGACASNGGNNASALFAKVFGAQKIVDSYPIRESAHTVKYRTCMNDLCKLESIVLFTAKKVCQNCNRELVTIENKSESCLFETPEKWKHKTL